MDLKLLSDITTPLIDPSNTHLFRENIPDKSSDLACNCSWEDNNNVSPYQSSEQPSSIMNCVKMHNTSIGSLNDTFWKVLWVCTTSGGEIMNTKYISTIQRPVQPSLISNYSEKLQLFVVSLVTGYVSVLTHKSQYDIQTDARHISITKAEMKTHKFITVIGFRK